MKRYILSEIDKKYINDNYAKLTGIEIAKFLNVTRGCINKYAMLNNLKKEIRKYNTGNEWKETEILYLIQNWEMSSVSDLMKRLNRTKWAVCSKKLELKKAGLL